MPFGGRKKKGTFMYVLQAIQFFPQTVSFLALIKCILLEFHFLEVTG